MTSDREVDVASYGGNVPVLTELQLSQCESKSGEMNKALN